MLKRSLPVPSVVRRFFKALPPTHRLRLLRALSSAATPTSPLASGTTPETFRPADIFEPRHIGPREEDMKEMLDVVGYASIDDMIYDAVPNSIRHDSALNLPPPLTETEALKTLRDISKMNKVYRSCIGMGYYNTVVPTVILRNMMENPGWYTSYTPYQAEISQGRLESLLNFQTVITELTGMAISNASLLDEATAAAEAMSLSYAIANRKRNKFFVSETCHPQNISLVQSRGESVGIEVEVGNPFEADLSSKEYCGILLQYPDTYGAVENYESLAATAKENGTAVVAATDLMALVKLRPPGEWGADVVIGSAQRFGVPMGLGGPHAAFLATREEHQRKMPGRVIGMTKDSRGKPALRMAMQTREQHIRRDKATSNICTAQALLANMAAMYCVYHGPEGLKTIAERIHRCSVTLALALEAAGHTVRHDSFFDTISVDVSSRGRTAEQVIGLARARGINLRQIDETTVGVSFDETTTFDDIVNLLGAFDAETSVEDLIAYSRQSRLGPHARSSIFMQQEVFNVYRSETQMLRYLHRLQFKDISLVHSMIPLGSCTMKLNASSEMIPVTWPEFAHIHPFAPVDQWAGYDEVVKTLSEYLADITGFAAVSCQPNSGAQGEFAGLKTIRAYLNSINQGHRDVCLIPVSAHGTNPASAVMAGLKVVVVKSDEEGNIDREDFKAKVAKHGDRLAAFMVTYPSTFGVFEEGIKEIIDLVHAAGGQVYMDGANMNAQVGLTSPGAIGADVCHLNLHKTFCIPHGGGGPGVGAIGVASHLAPFLPGHAVVSVGGYGDNTRAKHDIQVSGAPHGSPLILPISWMYIRMLGGEGLRRATQTAILNANYMAKRLEPYFDIAFKGKNGLVAHEFIIDIRPFKKYGIVEEDIAKRLMDYGFHAPTMSWPVPGTLMVEPTESEDRKEIDRFCESMISIRQEIQDVIDGKVDKENNVLKRAPHTADMVISDSWDRPYSREQAVYPLPGLRSNKFWPTVGRVDNVYGDRHLICSCPPLQSYLEENPNLNE